MVQPQASLWCVSAGGSPFLWWSGSSARTSNSKISFLQNENAPGLVVQTALFNWSDLIYFILTFFFYFICSHLVVPMIRLCGSLLPPTPQRSPWSHTLMKRATWRARSCLVILKAHWQCVALPPMKWLSLAGKSNWCPMVRTHSYQNPQRSLLVFSLSFELKFDGVSTIDI